MFSPLWNALNENMKKHEEAFKCDKNRIISFPFPYLKF